MFNVKKFRAFVASKGSKVINHRYNKESSSCWCNCAVGAYYRHSTGKPRPECSASDYSKLSNEIAVELPGVLLALNNYTPRTYAKLLELI